jgi:predicted TIM-barrel fold metal-dependent hydrolase
VSSSAERRYVIISSDNHAGADLYDYKPYLAKKWHDEFDAWAAEYQNPWDFLDPQIDDEFDSEDAILRGASSTHTTLNWDSGRRVEHMNHEGVVAEVIFPNTAPPFMPSSVLSGIPPSNRSEYEHWWAGLQAHNRWLVDFCAKTPGQRVGVAQIMTYDVDDAVGEVKAMAAAGMTGGILLPMDPRDAGVSTPLFFTDFDPLWAACQEAQLPVHRHSSTPSNFLVNERTGYGAIAIGFAERQFYNHRPLAQFILSGIFERFPELKLVFAESGAGWVPGQIRMLDALYESGRDRNGLLDFLAPALTKLSLAPSEYFRRNVFLGASLFLPGESELRYEIGVDNIMWGVDYPHSEGTYPYSLQALRMLFGRVPEDEVRKMLGATAAEVYRFDYEFLQGLADQVGPTVQTIREEPELPRVPEESVSPVFAPLALLELERSRPASAE